MWSPSPVFVRIIFWTIYSCICTWATVGVGCWLILLRNLWGPVVAKKYPIKEAAFAIIIVGAVGVILTGPFILVWKGLSMGSVAAVEACQRRFCGDALEDAEDDGRNLELEEGRALVSSEYQEDQEESEGVSQSFSKGVYLG